MGMTIQMFSLCLFIVSNLKIKSMSVEIICDLKVVCIMYMPFYVTGILTFIIPSGIFYFIVYSKCRHSTTSCHMATKRSVAIYVNKRLGRRHDVLSKVKCVIIRESRKPIRSVSIHPTTV